DGNILTQRISFMAIAVPWISDIADRHGSRRRPDSKGGRPTTHILKPFIQALEGSVENELFCLRLAARLKLPVPDVQMRGRGPFHSFWSNGTTVRDTTDLIGRATARPAADRLSFIRMLIFHYLVGNANAHGKNYALLYRGAGPRDVVCTVAYPRLAKKLAMAIGGRSVPDTIQLQHWLTLVSRNTRRRTTAAHQGYQGIGRPDHTRRRRSPSGAGGGRCHPHDSQDDPDGH
ncbi:HipA domain-containing protein, partial [Bradyrhizobium sp. 143]|uniref:HipA domain-containing protein n=1 Tax=Bradyrhizobium sp. 143 TaxID=2782619 RepID=UPI001FF9D0CE